MSERADAEAARSGDERRLAAVSATLSGLAYDAWHFGDSVAFEGMVAASNALGDERHAAFAHGFVRAWEARRVGYRELDCTAPGRAICQLYERSGDTAILRAAQSLATYLTTHRARVSGVFATWEAAPLRHPYGPSVLPPDEAALVADPGRGVFVDCLHFDPPFFAALGRVGGDPAWTSHALDQTLGYVRLLQDDDTGLFHHFHLERTGRGYVRGWGRGQGWALLGLLDVLDDVPESAERRQLAAAAARLCAAMRSLQRPDGQWFAVVDDPLSGDESSTAAFMALGFRRAIRAGVVRPEQFVDAARLAGTAVRRAVTAGGVLPGVSAAVWACTAVDHYRHVPTGLVVPWGQGPTALLLADVVLHPDHAMEDAG